MVKILSINQYEMKHSQDIFQPKIGSPCNNINSRHFLLYLGFLKYYFFLFQNIFFYIILLSSQMIC